MLSPHNLPARDPAVSIQGLARAKAQEVVLEGDHISPTDAPKSLAFTSRLIEGHPDDIPDLRAALAEPLIRAALLADLERDDQNINDLDEDDRNPVIGRATVKILSAIFAAKATTFDGFLILSFPPISTHLQIFRQPRSAHQMMQLHARDPDLDAIIARPWQAPFHGHAHHWSYFSWRVRRIIFG